jgi:zinc transport system ATP-binding protein
MADKNLILKVKNLSIVRGSEHIIEDLSFEVPAGKMLAVVGPNGAGKTMLFRALLGLTEYEGEIVWRKAVRVGYVPQRFAVEKDFPITVAEFLGFKNSRREAQIKALLSLALPPHGHAEKIDEHHIAAHLLDKRLSDLSGGELQRALIAYALFDEPEILLFDEPTAGIDIGGEETIYSRLHKLQDEHHLTVLLISHDLNIVYKYADDVLCLNKQKVCFGEPTKVLDEKTLQLLYGGEAALYRHTH